MNHLYELPVFKNNQNLKIIMEVENAVTAFSGITHIPVSYFSGAGKFLWCSMPHDRVCDANTDYGSDSLPCTRNLISSMNISLSIPEPYMFMCNAGLINICMPFVPDGQLYGFLIAGPVAMGNEMDKILQNVSRNTAQYNIDYSVLLPTTHNLKLYSPKEITYLKILFQGAVTSVISESDSDSKINQNFQEQSEISRKLLQMKRDQLDVEYPHSSEQALTDSIVSGNTGICLKRFSKYVEDVMVFEGGNLALTKLRIIGLLSHILKTDLKEQNNYDNMYLLEKINESQSMKDIVLSGKSLIMSLARSAAECFYDGSSEIIKAAVSHIHSSFRDPVTLNSTAELLHVNSAYLSALFKQETGCTFISYLNSVRLEYSRKLLSNSSMTVTEACMNSGFSSVSYFTKQFKSKYGITPKEFKKRK